MACSIEQLRGKKITIMLAGLIQRLRQAQSWMENQYSTNIEFSINCHVKVLLKQINLFILQTMFLSTSFFSFFLDRITQIQNT